MQKCEIDSILNASATDRSYFLIRSYKIPVIGGLKKLYLVLKKSWKSLEFQSLESVGALGRGTALEWCFLKVVAIIPPPLSITIWLGESVSYPLETSHSGSIASNHQDKNKFSWSTLIDLDPVQCPSCSNSHHQQEYRPLTWSFDHIANDRDLLEV